jgi:EmrB/QacA subfamily drug resistance transporter
VFAIVSMGVMLATIDQFIVNIAFTAIGHGLHGSISTLSWVLNGYSIVFAALLVPAGRLADRGGRKRGFLFGVALFTAASAACAITPDVAFLIGARVVQGVGAAFLVPSSLGLLLAAFPPERRAAAVSGWAAVTGASAALGPVLGGLLVAVDWRLIFLVNLPIGLVALVAGSRWLPALSEEPTPLPDLVGAGALVVATAALTLALVKGQDWGWSSAKVTATLAAPVALGLFFARRSLRHPSPVVEPTLLRVPRFSLAILGTTLYSAAFAAMILALILWAQTAWDWPALRSGLAFAPGPLAVPLFSRLSVRLTHRIGPGLTAATGCAVLALSALIAIGREMFVPNYLLAMLPAAVLMGAGGGLALPTFVSAGAGVLPADRFATGSGVLNMARQLGFTLGVAILVAVLGAPGHGQHQLQAFRDGWIAVVVLALLGAAAGVAPVRPVLVIGRAIADRTERRRLDCQS